MSGAGSRVWRPDHQPVNNGPAAWRQFFTPLIFQKASFTNYAGTPRFEFDEETAGTVAGRVAPAVFGLAIPAIALVWFALARLARFPIVS